MFKAKSHLFIFACLIWILGIGIYIAWDIVEDSETLKSNKFVKPPPCDCDTENGIPCKINGICLRLYYDPEIFFPHGTLLYRYYSTGQQFNLEDAPRIIFNIEEFISRYDSNFIRGNLTDIFILKKFMSKGKPYGGTYYGSSIYINVDSNYPDQEIRKTLHHEFASILRQNYSFPESEWKLINDSSFPYTGKVFEMLDQPYSQELLLDSLEAGFLSEYAKTSLDNDFSTYSEWLFTRENEFCEIRKKYDRIDKKANIAIKFYQSIDSGSTFLECERSNP
jgi:hypothetical protein